MSLKRVLGMMLASQMGSRGRRRGGLGSAAMLGGLGMRRRRGMGGKLGLAAMGYMAHQAYQDHQRRTGGGNTGASATSRGGMGGGAGTTGGIGDMILDVTDGFTGGAISRGAMSGGSMSGGTARSGGQAAHHLGAPTGASPEANFQEDERRAAAEFSEEKARLLLRAMVTAAYSDGALSEAERGRIMGEIEEFGGDAEDRRTMEREIANPRPLDELLAQVNDHETAEEFYLPSRAAIDGDTEQNRAYLGTLRQRLGLSEQDAAEVEEIAS